jgi:hypothetical protein
VTILNTTLDTQVLGGDFADDRFGTFEGRGLLTAGVILSFPSLPDRDVRGTPD